MNFLFVIFIFLNLCRSRHIDNSSVMRDCYLGNQRDSKDTHCRYDSFTKNPMKVSFLLLIKYDVCRFRNVNVDGLEKFSRGEIVSIIDYNNTIIPRGLSIKLIFVNDKPFLFIEGTLKNNYTSDFSRNIRKENQFIITFINNSAFIQINNDAEINLGTFVNDSDYMKRNFNGKNFERKKIHYIFGKNHSSDQLQASVEKINITNTLMKYASTNSTNDYPGDRFAGELKELHKTVSNLTIFLNRSDGELKELHKTVSILRICLGVILFFFIIIVVWFMKIRNDIKKMTLERSEEKDNELMNELPLLKEQLPQSLNFFKNSLAEKEKMDTIKDNYELIFRKNEDSLSQEANELIHENDTTTRRRMTLECSSVKRKKAYKLSLKKDIIELIEDIYEDIDETFKRILKNTEDTEVYYEFIIKYDKLRDYTKRYFDTFLKMKIMNTPYKLENGEENTKLK